MGDAPAAPAAKGAGVRLGLALAAAVSGLVSSETAASPAAAAPSSSHDARGRVAPAGARTLPEAIGARPTVRQMITVSARSWNSRHARLEAWRRGAEGSWRRAHSPIRVIIGYGGWVVAEDRVQSTGTTPAGRFNLPYAFGRYADPGAHLRYRRVDGDDWWPYEPRDPATYNVYQFHKAKKTHWRRDKAEHLDSYTKQYGYAVVIGFNLPRQIHYSAQRRQWVAEQRAHIHRGGGIFLHIRGDGYTAGCVATSRSNMRWLVGWLRPNAHPGIVMGPHDYILTL